METCGTAVGDVSVALAFVLIEHMTVTSQSNARKYETILQQPLSQHSYIYVSLKCYREAKRRHTLSALVQPFLSTCTATHDCMETKLYLPYRLLGMLLWEIKIARNEKILERLLSNATSPSYCTVHKFICRLLFSPYLQFTRDEARGNVLYTLGMFCKVKIFMLVVLQQTYYMSRSYRY